MNTANRYFPLLLSFFISMLFLNASAQSVTKNLQLPDTEITLHNNQVLNLASLKGKVVLLDFWHRGCAPCLQAIPELIALQEEFKDDLVIIGVNAFDIQEDVVSYAAYKKMNYYSTFKKEGVNLLKALGINVTAFPTTMLYGKDGAMIKNEAGYSKGTMKSLRRAIVRALKD